MALRPIRRLVVLPGVVQDAREEAPAPVEALRRLLGGHLKAPHLLSQARHRAILARESADEAARAARVDRDAELAHELAVRECDRRDRWRLHFGIGAIAVAALLLVCGTAALVMIRGLPWPDRVVIPLAVLLCGAVAWRAAMSHDSGWKHDLVLFAGMAWAAVLGALCVLSTTGGLVFRVVAAVALGLILVATYSAAAWVMEHAENWHCARLRRTSEHAARFRQAAAAAAARDEAAAEAAMAAWESLVVEECQLAHPGAVVSETWLDDCVSVARTIATPE